MAQLSVSVLGPFEARAEGREVHIPAGRARTGLVSLALSARRVVPIDVLAEHLWGEALPADPRAGVHNVMLRLRRALGPVAGPDVIRTEVDGYVLELPPDRVDALRFDRLVRDSSAADPARARDLLEEALALWRGDPLGGLGSDVLIREHRPALTERYLTAVERRVDLDLACGSYAGVIAELETMVGQHPFRESLWLRLIDALHRQGRRAEALDHYERLRQMLADSLGTDPSVDVGLLHQAILRQPVGEQEAATDVRTESPANGADPSVGSGATEAATDETHGPAVPVSGSATRSSSHVPRQLPTAQYGFVGRVSELAVLNRLPENDAGIGGVAVVHGTGGIGKTSLALAWAHSVRHRFPDGQLYLDLRGYGPGEPVDPPAALGTLLRAFGVRHQDLPADPDERSALLRTTVAGRRVLVVLDNARDAEQVRPLLPGSGAVVVVTSRSQLRPLVVRDGASDLFLRELDDNEAHAILAGRIGHERVAAEPDATAALLALCGRLPLAVRIAADHAARFSDVPLAELSTALADRRDAFHTDSPDIDLPTVFSWSYAALPERPAGAFRRLGLYPGNDIGVHPAAALIGVGVEEARRLLARLAEQHLVEEPRPDRYRLHDLLRDYAGDRLAAEESAEQQVAAVRRLLDWYVHAAVAANRALQKGAWTVARRPPPNVAEPVVPTPVFASAAQAQQWCEDERLTVLAAARDGAEHGLDQHVCELARGLNAFQARRGYVDDRMLLGDLALRSARRLDDPDHISHIATGLAWVNLSRADVAVPLLELALEHAKRVGPARTYLVYDALAAAHYTAGQPEKAVEFHERAIATAESADRPGIRGQALGNCAYTLQLLGRYADSIEQAEQALTVYTEQGGGDYEVAFIRRTLAGAHVAAAETPGGDRSQAVDSRHCDPERHALAAIDHCEHAMTLERRIEHRSGICDTLTLRGRANAVLGRRETARADLTEALAMLRDDTAADHHEAVTRIQGYLATLETTDERS